MKWIVTIFLMLLFLPMLADVAVLSFIWLLSAPEVTFHIIAANPTHVGFGVILYVVYFVIAVAGMAEAHEEIWNQ